ncbi:MAG: hypothetical protein AB1403_14040 [Candidatus Riflebacteria bacterium]
MSPNLQKPFFSPSDAAPAVEFNKCAEAEFGRRSGVLQTQASRSFAISGHNTSFDSEKSGELDAYPGFGERVRNER